MGPKTCICNHNNHSPLAKNRKAFQFKRKLSIYSTIWPNSPLYHLVNRSGRRFDLVGCFHLFSSSYTRSYGHLSKSQNSELIVVYDDNIGQVITQDSFLAIIVHD